MNNAIPFGMKMNSRSYTDPSYSHRYGFNGMPEDNELKGEGNSLDFGARFYDPRVGRFLRLDPLYNKYPNISPYVAFADNPIMYIDLDGWDWILSKGNKIIWYAGNYGDTKTVLKSFKATSGIDKAAGTQNGKPFTVDGRNSKYQSIPNIGPTPEGKYRINLIPDPNRVAEANTKGEIMPNSEGGIEKLPEFVPNPDNPSYGWMYPDWGKLRAHLEPINVTGAVSDDVDPKHGRNINSFYFHDSEKGYTHGCTEVESSFFEMLINYRNAGNKSIDVKIDYPNNNYNTNGGTKKEETKKENIGEESDGN